MNKCNLYILTFLTGLLVSCAQQNEAGYENNASDQAAIVEESLVETPYYWEDEALESYDDMDSNLMDEEQENSNQQEEVVRTDQQKDLEGMETQQDELDNVDDKESKLIKAFIKQNIADLFDLGTLYLDENKSKEMRLAIKSEMMQVLANGDFESFEQSLFFNNSSNKKLSFEKIETTEDGNYVGVIQIITKSKSNRIAFKVSSETLDYGVSRKFEILKIAY